MHILSSDVAYHCVTSLPSVVLHVHTGENPRLTSNPRYILPPSPLLLPPLPLSPLTTPSPERRRDGLVKKEGSSPSLLLPPQPPLYLTSSPSPLSPHHLSLPPPFHTTSPSTNSFPPGVKRQVSVSTIESPLLYTCPCDLPTIIQ